MRADSTEGFNILMGLPDELNNPTPSDGSHSGKLPYLLYFFTFIISFFPISSNYVPKFFHTDTTVATSTPTSPLSPASSKATTLGMFSLAYL